MAGDTQPRPWTRRSRVALAFAICGCVACWNPFAAPFGLVVSAVAVILAARAVRGAPAPRRVPLLALALSILATLTSLVVIVSTAGVVSVELPGEPVVKGRTQAELNQVLSDSAERTRARREQAERELDALGGQQDGGTATPKTRPEGAAKSRGAEHP